jgi:ferrous iron transport protein B
MNALDLAPADSNAAASKAAPIRVALVGNPNSGKTAMFNALTGARQKVANYAGVTVERKEGFLTSPAGRKVSVLDLPGTYSLRARSPDEEVTRDVVLGQRPGERAPDLLVAVADATNLRLVLRLILELKQTGQPAVLALNMIDIAQRQGIDINLAALAREIGMPVVTTVATRKRGIDDLLAAIDARADQSETAGASTWSAPSAKDIRDSHREAERILKIAVLPPKRPDTWTGKIDSVLLHPVSGILILLAVLFLMFQAVFSWGTALSDGIKAGFDWTAMQVTAHVPAGLVQSLITDGLISGVGSVVAFLPQIMILFFFIILLEDFGYMARAAFLMDRIMGGAGLHGRAFIPLLSSFACAIPGIMSTRVIDQKRDRLTTILVAPLMTCSARIPVYTLIIGAFIPNKTYWGWISLQGLVMLGLYIAGAVSALAVAFVVRKIFWRGAAEPFIMELPAYKLPDAKNVARNVILRAEIFLKRAGTTILSMMVLIWFLSTVPFKPAGAPGPAIDYSFAGIIGHALQPLLAPIGFNWQMAVALVPGMAAREVAVGALGTVYAIGDGNPGQLASSLAHQWSLPTALSFLAWYIFAPQCASTLGVVKRETNSWRWPIIMFVYMIALAYVAALITFQVASRF